MQGMTLCKCRVALPRATLQAVLTASRWPAGLLFLIKSLFGGNSISFLSMYELDKFCFSSLSAYIFYTKESICF